MSWTAMERRQASWRRAGGRQRERVSKEKPVKRVPKCRDSREGAEKAARESRQQCHQVLSPGLHVWQVQ